MLEFVIKSVMEIKKHTDTQNKIPFIYMLFLISIFIFCNPNFIVLIDASNWVPFNIKEILLMFVNLIYSKYSVLATVLIGLFIIIHLLIEFNLFEKILPKNIHYADGTTVSWNACNASSRLLRIFGQLSTTGWILYFLINIVFNEHDYVKYFFVKESNPLVIIEYISEKNLYIMNGLFCFNAIVAGFFIIKFLFETEISRDVNCIDKDEISLFYIINTFEQNNTLNGNSEIVIIAKRKYSTKSNFFLARAMNLGYTFNENNFKKRKQIQDYSYRIIDSSENLSDIIYHFNVLKDKNMD